MVVGQDVSVSVQNPVYGSVGFQSCQVVIEGQMPDLLANQKCSRVVGNGPWAKIYFLLAWGT